MDDYISARMENSMEAFSRRKKYIPVARWEVAYVEAGKGAPLFLLHGCPFHSYEWSAVIPLLAPYYRVFAPDLLGLGDTRVRLSDDYYLPQQAAMIVGLMDALDIPKAFFVRAFGRALAWKAGYIRMDHHMTFAIGSGLHKMGGKEEGDGWCPH